MARISKRRAHDSKELKDHLVADRKSTRLNSSHTEIYTLSLHDALPILDAAVLTMVISESTIKANNIMKSHGKVGFHDKMDEVWSGHPKEAPKMDVWRG